MDRSLLTAESVLRVLALCAVFVAPKSVLSTASAQDGSPHVMATHQWSATTDNGDGTYGVVFEVSFTNSGAAAVDDLTVELIEAAVAPVLPGENVLTVGSLNPGKTVTTSWRITTYAPMAPGMEARPLFIHGEGVDEAGFPIGVGILSRGRPVSRSATAAAEKRAIAAREAPSQ